MVTGVDERRERVATHRPRAARGLERDETVVVVVTGRQPHVEPFYWEQRADAFTPLDDHDRSTADELVEADVVQLLEMVEAIDVDMDERHRALVLTHEREGGAHHFFVDTERSCDALREHRLPRAEITREHDDVAGRKIVPTRAASENVSCRRARAHRQRGHVARAPASARFTCTKSARACASAAPPFRRTAAGWSVGMRTA